MAIFYILRQRVAILTPLPTVSIPIRPVSDFFNGLLGIPALRDRVVQMALKLVLEPIFEADFYPASYGYRPGRRVQDAIAAITHIMDASPSYDYVIEGDIKGCFDTIDHDVLVSRVHERIEDRDILMLIKAFLHAGVIRETGRFAPSVRGCPQGGIISPILCNVYLGVLDRYFGQTLHCQNDIAEHGTPRRQPGNATYRLVRYADDFVILMRGTREQAEAIRDEAARIIRDDLKMELSAEKTLITHVTEGFDFLGHHICKGPGKNRPLVRTYPSNKSLEAIKRKVKALTTRTATRLSLKGLLMLLNPALQSWAMHFRYDASKRAFGYVDCFTGWQIAQWLRKKHPGHARQCIWTRFAGDGRRFHEDGIELFRTATIKTERYRYRGQHILLPWMDHGKLEPLRSHARLDFDEGSRTCRDHRHHQTEVPTGKLLWQNRNNDAILSWDDWL